MIFEIDKVYKAREGSEWRVVCIGENFIIAINELKNSCLSLEKDGKVYNKNYIQDKSSKDLIELVGNDFTPKEVKKVYKWRIIKDGTLTISENYHTDEFVECMQKREELNRNNSFKSRITYEMPSTIYLSKIEDNWEIIK